jgi:hypothetical protein
VWGAAWDEQRIASGHLAFLDADPEPERAVDHNPCLIVGPVQMQSGDRAAGMYAGLPSLPIRNHEGIADDTDKKLPLAAASRGGCRVNVWQGGRVRAALVWWPPVVEAVRASGPFSGCCGGCSVLVEFEEVVGCGC